MNFLNRKVKVRWNTLVSIVMGFVLIFTASAAIFVQHVEAREAELVAAINSANQELAEAQNKLSNSEAELEKQASEIEDVKIKLESTENKLFETNNELFLNKEELAQKNEDIAEIQNNMFNSNQVYGVIITDSDVELIAKTLWGEARGLSKFEQSMVVWCILNRVDYSNSTIKDVVTAASQFHGYHANNPLREDLVALTRDVIARWQLEKVCAGEVGRTLPAEYRWFYGDGKHNYYRNKYSGDYDTWDWSNCWNPYENWD